MNLSKEEKNILAIEQFFVQFMDYFENISTVNIKISSVDDCPKYYNANKKYYPLLVSVTKNNGDISCYYWLPDSSDDEYPLYSKDGEHYSFHDVKEYIQRLIPEAFHGKAFYKKEEYFNNENIKTIAESVHKKLSAINLENQLKINSFKSTSKFKI